MTNCVELPGLSFARQCEGFQTDFVFHTLFSRYSLPRLGYRSTDGFKISWDIPQLLGLPSCCPYEGQIEGMIYESVFNFIAAKSLSGLAFISEPFFLSRNPLENRSIAHFDGEMDWALLGCISLPQIGWLVDTFEQYSPPNMKLIFQPAEVWSRAKDVYPEKGSVIGFVTTDLVGAIEFRVRLDKTRYAVDLWSLSRLEGSKNQRKPTELHFPLNEEGTEKILLGRLQ